MADELFTKRMRQATRKIHAVSDALVNAKLLFALNNNDVWAEGLLIFYEIFKYLEVAMREGKNENLQKLYIEEMNRTSAFENDLNFYLGLDWKKSYEMRNSVKDYLNHLQHLQKTDSDLLMAYVYHLYMGLLSGGQILRKKRQLQSKVVSCESTLGNAITDFGGEEISSLKTKLKDAMNSVAEELDEQKKLLLIEESNKVFELNNSIIRTVQGTDKVAFQNMVFFSCAFLAIAIICYFIKKAIFRG